MKELGKRGLMFLLAESYHFGVGAWSISLHPRLSLCYGVTTDVIEHNGDKHRMISTAFMLTKRGPVIIATGIGLLSQYRRPERKLQCSTTSLSLEYSSNSGLSPHPPSLSSIRSSVV